MIEAIILLPAHELLPIGGIKRLINNSDKNVVFAQGADGNPHRNEAIVVGAIDEVHKNWGNLLSKLGCSALAAETCPVRGSSSCAGSKIMASITSLLTSLLKTTKVVLVSSDNEHE